MTQDHNEKQALKQMRMDVFRILVSWDPLGMKGLRDGEREYDQYVGALVTLIRREAKPGEICQHLVALCDQWKLPNQGTKPFLVAEKIYRIGAILRGEQVK